MHHEIGFFHRRHAFNAPFPDFFAEIIKLLDGTWSTVQTPDFRLAQAFLRFGVIGVSEDLIKLKLFEDAIGYDGIEALTVEGGAFAGPAPKPSRKRRWSSRA